MCVCVVCSRACMLTVTFVKCLQAKCSLSQCSLAKCSLSQSSLAKCSLSQCSLAERALHVAGKLGV